MSTSDKSASRKSSVEVTLELTPALDAFATAVRDMGGTMCVAAEIGGHLIIRRSAKGRFDVTAREPDEGACSTDQEFAPAGTMKALTGAYHALRSYQYGNSATDLAQDMADHLAALLGEDDGVAHHLLPPRMTPAIEDVLGQLNFIVGPIAHLFQAAGHDIPKRYESEQAHVLFRFLHLALQHGDGWRAEANKLLGEARAAISAQQPGSDAP